MPPNKVNLSWCSILHCSRLFRAQLLLGALFFYCGYHAEKWRAHERRWVLSAAVPLWPRVRDTEQSPRRSHDFPLLHLEKQLVDEVYHVQPWRELNSFQLNSPFRAPQHSIHDYTLKAPAWQDGADESRGNSNPIIGTDLRKKVDRERQRQCYWANRIWHDITTAGRPQNQWLLVGSHPRIHHISGW